MILFLQALGRFPCIISLILAETKSLNERRPSKNRNSSLRSLCLACSHSFNTSHTTTVQPHSTLNRTSPTRRRHVASTPEPLSFSGFGSSSGSSVLPLRRRRGSTAEPMTICRRRISIVAHNSVRRIYIIAMLTIRVAYAVVRRRRSPLVVAAATVAHCAISC